MSIGSLVLIIILGVLVFILVRKSYNTGTDEGRDQADTKKSLEEMSPNEIHISTEARWVDAGNVPDEVKTQAWDQCYGFVKEIKEKGKYVFVRVDEELFERLKARVVQDVRNLEAVRPVDCISGWSFSPDKDEAGERCKSLVTKTFAKDVAIEVSRVGVPNKSVEDGLDAFLEEVKAGLLLKKGPFETLAKKSLIRVNHADQEKFESFLKEQTKETLTIIATENEIPVKSSMRKAEMVAAIMENHDKIDLDWLVGHVKSTNPASYTWSEVVDKVILCVRNELERQYEFAERVVEGQFGIH
ncbi:hypothetical protein D6779_09840 [Candidatus Parcubacteria bacterium]|nr:MAG: hypothetical protein D6779_09840 [Candidatus Parcubacteria bacterium]